MPAGGMDMSHDMATPEARSLTVPLNELGGSGLSGEATLTETADGTDVSLMVNGPAGDNPVHVHYGTCDNLGEVAVALTNIDANGNSDTVVPLTIDELTGAQYAINAHESAENIANYVACGDITG